MDYKSNTIDIIKRLDHAQFTGKVKKADLKALCSAARAEIYHWRKSKPVVATPDTGSLEIMLKERDAEIARIRRVLDRYSQALNSIAFSLLPKNATRAKRLAARAARALTPQRSVDSHQ